MLLLCTHIRRFNELLGGFVVILSLTNVVGCGRIHRPPTAKNSSSPLESTPSPAATTTAATKDEVKSIDMDPGYPMDWPTNIPQQSSVPNVTQLDSSSNWITLSPGLRINKATEQIEIDATVPIDAHDPSRQRVYLEWLVCTPNTREHEVVAVTQVRPSLIHAAALTFNWQPGIPGAWDWSGDKIVPVPPQGEAVQVYIRTEGTPAPGNIIETWVVNAKTGKTLAEEFPANYFVFSGSRVLAPKGPNPVPLQSFYHADREGGVLGLACFSNETFAYSAMINPDAGIEEPVWIANAANVPPAGTNVIVTFSRKR